MIRSTLTKIRRICLLALDRSGRVHKSSFGPSKAQHKATPLKSNDVNENESERCRKIIDECFEPHKPEEVQHYHEELARLHKEQLAGLISQYEHCERCQKIIAKIFNKDHEIDRLTLKEIDYTTTAKEGNENELVQKLETIEEAKVVETERIHVEYNQPPRILAASANISNKIDEIAKRCLEKADNKINDRLVLEMVNLTIPSFKNDNEQKRLCESGIIIQEESSEILTEEEKFELQPTFTSLVRDKNLVHKDDKDSNASLQIGCSIPFHLFHKSALTGDKDNFKEEGLSPLELITPAKFEYNLDLHKNYDAEQEKIQSSNVQSAPLDDVFSDKISTKEELPAPKVNNQQESNMFGYTQRGFNVLDPNTIVTDPYDKSSPISKENDFGHSNQTLFFSKQLEDYEECIRQQQGIFAELLTKQREKYEELFTNQQVKLKEGPKNLKDNVMDLKSEGKDISDGIWSGKKETVRLNKPEAKLTHLVSKPKENIEQWSHVHQGNVTEWSNKPKENATKLPSNSKENIAERPIAPIKSITEPFNEQQEITKSNDNVSESTNKQQEIVTDMSSKENQKEEIIKEQTNPRNTVPHIAINTMTPAIETTVDPNSKNGVLELTVAPHDVHPKIEKAVTETEPALGKMLDIVPHSEPKTVDNEQTCTTDSIPIIDENCGSLMQVLEQVRRRNKLEYCRSQGLLHMSTGLATEPEGKCKEKNPCPPPQPKCPPPPPKCPPPPPKCPPPPPKCPPPPPECPPPPPKCPPPPPECPPPPPKCPPPPPECPPPPPKCPPPQPKCPPPKPKCPPPDPPCPKPCPSPSPPPKNFFGKSAVIATFSDESKLPLFSSNPVTFGPRKARRKASPVQCERCQKIIDECFEPHKPEEVQKYHEELARLHQEQLAGEKEIDRMPLKEIDYTTTAKEGNRNELVQKIKTIDEAKVVETEKIHIEYNEPPRILAANPNISNKIDEIAKRYLEEADNKIDDRLVLEMGKLAIPSFDNDNAQKRLREPEIVIKEDSSKILTEEEKYELQPPFTNMVREKKLIENDDKDANLSLQMGCTLPFHLFHQSALTGDKDYFNEGLSPSELITPAKSEYRFHVHPKIEKVVAETEPALGKMLDIVPLTEPMTIENEQICLTDSIPIIDENCGSLMQVLEQVRRRNKLEYCRSQRLLHMSAGFATEPEGKSKEKNPCVPLQPKCPKENVIKWSSKQKENVTESTSNLTKNVSERPIVPIKSVTDPFNEQQEIYKSEDNEMKFTNDHKAIVKKLSSKQKENDEILDGQTNLRDAIPHTAMSTMVPAIETTIHLNSNENVLELTEAPHVHQKIDKVFAETEPAFGNSLGIVPLAEPKTVGNEQTCTTVSIPINDENCESLMQQLEQVRRRNRLEYCRSQGLLHMSARCATEPEGKCKKQKPCPPPQKKCPPKLKPQTPCPPPSPPCPIPCKPKCPTACPPGKSPCNEFAETPLLKQLILVVSQLSVIPKSSAIEEFNRLVKDSTSESIQVTKCLEYFNEPEVVAPGVEAILNARDYEPWIPIPSWPIPKKEEKQQPACAEKPGCKVLPPPKLSDPCNENPCKNLPWTRKWSFSLTHLFSKSDDRKLREWI